MAIQKQHKVVNVLPETLEANSIYFVKVGAGFDLYVTNNIGVIIPSKINGGGGTLEQGQGYESETYIYAVFGNDTMWEVYRYDRNNNLIKTIANGTGTKPDDLNSLEALTYQ